MEKTFSAILHRILQENNLDLKKFYNELNDVGIIVTYSSLYAYYIGTTTPPYSLAKRIIKHSKMDIQTDELEEIITNSKKQAKEYRDENKILNINAKIKPENIDVDYEQNASGLKSIIELRVDELFSKNDGLVTQISGGKKKLSAYVAYLIKKDLEENGIIKRKS